MGAPAIVQLVMALATTVLAQSNVTVNAGAKLKITGPDGNVCTITYVEGSLHSSCPITGPDSARLAQLEARVAELGVHTGLAPPVAPSPAAPPAPPFVCTGLGGTEITKNGGTYCYFASGYDTSCYTACTSRGLACDWDAVLAGAGENCGSSDVTGLVFGCSNCHSSLVNYGVFPMRSSSGDCYGGGTVAQLTAWGHINNEADYCGPNPIPAPYTWASLACPCK